MEGVKAVCHFEPKIMARFAENEGKGYYSKDSGIIWTKMKEAGGSGGKGQ